MVDFRPWIYFKSILALNWTPSISNEMERIQIQVTTFLSGMISNEFLASPVLSPLQCPSTIELQETTSLSIIPSKTRPTMMWGLTSARSMPVGLQHREPKLGAMMWVLGMVGYISILFLFFLNRPPCNDEGLVRTGLLLIWVSICRNWRKTL